MHLKTVKLIQFKNYNKAQFEFSSALNFFSGENGSGKTNLLDAIHYLCLGKSYFHQSDQQAVKHATSFFRLEGNFLNGDEKSSITCVYKSAGKKEVSKSGVTYLRLTDHVGLIPVVMTAPDDQLLIDEGSEERRRFIDNTISQIDHFYLEDLVSYNKILQQRNAALKQFAFRNIFNATLIDSLDEQLAAFGKKIFDKRQHYVEKMVPLIEKYYLIICEGQERVSASYDSVFLHEDLLAALKNSIDKDRKTERTTEGIHRDEIEFLMNDLSIKKFGSQGQKKSFLIALKLAQWQLIKTEKNKTPILLLDDLFDKLDKKRSYLILKIMAEDGFGQVFITDTNLSRIKNFIEDAKKDSRLFEIKEGSVVQEL